jgi:hypothetical protein
MQTDSRIQARKRARGGRSSDDLTQDVVGLGTLDVTATHVRQPCVRKQGLAGSK